MPIEMDSASQIGAKWARVTPTRTQDYAEGVQNPKKDWAANAQAAEPSYDLGVQAAIADKRYGKGVAKTGTAGWKDAAVTKGTARWPAGVQGAESKYVTGMQPYVATLQGLTLPPRGAKGDPANIARVSAVVNALRQTKLAQL